jgi:hypothetical protein
MWFLIVAAAFLVGYGLGRREALVRHFESVWRNENRQVIEDIKAGRIGRPDRPSGSSQTPE